MNLYTENQISDMLEKCYEQYFDMFPNIHLDNEDECKHIETTTDSSDYYKVCVSCGKCVDFANIQVIEFNYIQNATVKRCYKKTNYLKLKLNKISKYLSNGNMTHIQKEFIKYDNLYAISGKKIKYDFILGQILISMDKVDVYNLHVKKFKNKLEKKRLKEFNQIININ